MNKLYYESFISEDYLSHYGVKGQKWGVRRFTNPDGSLTEEGRRHYGITERSSLINSQAHNYRVQRFGPKTGSFIEQRPEYVSRDVQAAQDAKRKKFIAKMAAVTLASIAVGIALHRRNKITRNLIEVAKNSVHDRYKAGESLNKTVKDQALHSYWRMKDIKNITSRKKALKELHLNGWKNRNRVKNFIKDNNLAKRKTSEFVEYRTGKLVEGFRRSKITGKMLPYTERRRRRAAEKIIRTRYIV